MVSAVRRIRVALLVGALVTMGSAGVAQAADAPKWVAALYVEAQKMVGLRWMPVPGATGYKVLRSTTSGSGYAEIGSMTAPQHFDDKLEPGTTYYYVLQSVAGAEVSANSEEKAVTIPGEKKVEKTPPPEWDKLNVTATTEFGKTHYKVGVFWKQVPRVLAYNVYRSTTPGKDYQLISSTAETRIIDTTVEVGKTYYYVLSALDPTFTETPYSEERSIEIVEKKVAQKKKKKKKEYPKMVPIGTRQLGDRALPNYPQDLLWHSDGTLYLALARLFTLDDFDGDYQELTGDFTQVGGIAEGLDGELILCEMVKRTVVVIDGATSREFSLPPLKEPIVNPENNQPFNVKTPFPFDVVQNVDGKYWVTDNANNRVLIFDEDFAFVRMAADGKDDGVVPSAAALARSSDGRVYAASGMLNAVFIYDKDGNFVGRFGETGNIAGTFGRIGGMHFDGEDNIYIADSMNSTIQKFDSNGKFLGALTSEDKKGAMTIGSPRTIAVPPEGTQIWVAEGMFKRLKLFDVLGY